MNDRMRLAMGVLVAGGIMGILGDALLRQKPWGLNILLWIGALAVLLLLLVRKGQVPMPSHWRWMVFTAVLFAAAFTWHDSLTLKLLNAMALLICLGLVALPAKATSIRLAGIMEYALEATSAGIYALCGILFLLFGDIDWKEIVRDGRLRPALAMGRGLIIAIPLLFIFSGLFMAADAVFEGIVNHLLHYYFDELFVHLFVTGLCTWMVSGFLRGVLLGKELVIRDVRRPKVLGLGVVETGVVLALLDLLFLGFIVVQFRYFFGGASQISAFTQLTHAEYARRGFFELVTVAALVLPILLLLQWLLGKEDPVHVRVFQLLAGAQIVMLFVIMASALQRMRLYQNEFGLTELRLYTTAFMAWLAVVFLWFAATVLRGQRERFAFGAMIAGLVAIVVLHGLNPDDLIIRTNAARALTGRTFDAKYATSLSADAVPALVACLSNLSVQDQPLVARRVLGKWPQLDQRDWRSWNWSRAKACQSMKDSEATLRQMAGNQ
jgi:hypothetical protein